MKAEEYLTKLKKRGIDQSYLHERSSQLAQATTVGGVLRTLCDSSFDVYQCMGILLDAADVEYSLEGAPSLYDYDT